MTDEQQISKENEMYISRQAYPINLIKNPERSDWQAQIFGNGDLVFVPTKGSEPNRFHRFMQRLCFGIVWKQKKP